MRRETTGREPDRAAVDRLAHDVGHLALLVFGGQLFDRALAHHVVTHGAVSNEACHVETRLQPLDRVEVAAVVFPVPRQAAENRVLRDVFDRLHHAREQIMVGRLAGRERHPAVPRHHSGDPLPAHRGAVWVPADLGIEVRLKIDEARRDDVPFGVDLLAPAAIDVSHGCDDAVVNREITCDGLVAGSVYELPASNYDVVCHAEFLRFPIGPIRNSG